MTAQSLVLYRPSPPSALTTTSSSRSLISSRLFTAQTGTAIATELLYRLLIDIINRFLSHFQQFASHRLDQFSSWLEQKAQERQQRQLEARAKKESGLQIVEQVGKLAEERGFVCPMGSGREPQEWMQRRGPPEPPMWVRSVLEGVREGRMEERDFWIQTHGD